MSLQSVSNEHIVLGIKVCVSQKKIWSKVFKASSLLTVGIQLVQSK